MQYRKLLAEIEGDPSRDEARYQMLLRLLADEVAKDAQPMILPGARSVRKEIIDDAIVTKSIVRNDAAV